MKIGTLCCVRDLLSIIAGFFLILSTAAGHTAEQKDLDVLATYQPIPVEEVAARSAEVADLLHTLRAQFTSSPEIKEIQNRPGKPAGEAQRRN